ncbi:ABC transporter ATP-binding protein [Vibrio sp. ZSDZ65]|uniref:ABC transporter ATP-binding protein n=1 Tax=Vibrio qingdaonensis TaxID=2829491 RepID=A0A9X3CTC8_9VIBR|nr:ABC transporter ATP-binding protein [Vibrio qingdaonensis]MCW8348135.1 ABC transporter ATP-binding protein [Vibrio qingdaonensis]
MSCDYSVEINDISKVYDVYEKPIDRLKQMFLGRFGTFKTEFTAVDNISFNIKKGDVVGILGRNGSGKSTLLQMICSTLSPSAGKCKVHGRVAALLELGSGFNPDFTGKENVYLNATLLGLSRKEVDDKYESIIEFSGVPPEFISQPIRNYSSGMVVRLAFSVIAHVDADILVVDEALSVGDAYFVQKCMRFLRSFMENGTIIFVSHDTSAILSLCNRAILLDSGSLVLDDSPKKVVETYLAQLYGNVNEDTVKKHKVNDDTDYIDQRMKFINNSNLRNDIDISIFNEESSGFGVGGVEVTKVKILDDNNQPLSWLVGGEFVSICVECETSIALDSPIIGFQLKDKLGQTILADNSYIEFMNKSLCFSPGDRFETKFAFRFPTLPVGEYSLGIAVANGSQENHIQHQWIHDALILTISSSSTVHGLIGIPMKNITIERLTS